MHKGTNQFSPRKGKENSLRHFRVKTVKMACSLRSTSRVYIIRRVKAKGTLN